MATYYIHEGFKLIKYKLMNKVIILNIAKKKHTVKRNAYNTLVYYVVSHFVTINNELNMTNNISFKHTFCTKYKSKPMPQM